MNLFPNQDSPSEMQRFLKSLRKPIKHSMLRRANWHDYSSRCVYMITFYKNPDMPVFSTLIGTIGIDKEIGTKLTPIGNAILKGFYQFNADYPDIEVCTNVIMPDHVHFILYVKKPTEKKLGHYISKLKGNCSRNYLEISGNNDLSPIFVKGFNDKILNKKGQWDTWKNYINDNPRRLRMRMQYPDLFKRANIITIDNLSHPVYGNIFLLKHPEKYAVKVSRRHSEEEKKENRKLWLACAGRNGILVSPFFHPEEKEIRKTAIEEGAGIIQIVEHPFAPREKPAKSDFELCSQGRLLFVALRQEPANSKTTLTKSLATRLNDLAAYIASLSDAQFKIKKPHPSPDRNNPPSE